jgi:hypothetical protein
MGLVYSNNNVYYYRSYREGTKVKHQYLGHGELALAVARAIQHKRDRKQAAREVEERRWRREVKRLETLDVQILKHVGLVNKVVEWTLINLGFYQHARTWRPRPMTTERRADLRKQVQDFWNRVAVGDPTTRDILKTFLDAAPEQFVSLFRGDMAKRVVEAILDRVAGQDLGQREAVLRQTQQHREGLADVYPSKIEDLLAERCAVLGLAAYEADLYMYNNMERLTGKKRTFHEDRRDRANRRFLSSMKTLALVKEKMAAVEERRARAARGEISRFRVGSGSDRMASVN